MDKEYKLIYNDFISKTVKPEEQLIYRELLSKFNLNKEELSEIAIDLINEINIKAKPEFLKLIANKEQQLIYIEIYNELVSQYKFNKEEISQIIKGLINKIDVTIYAKPEFSWEQMFEIRLG